LICFVDLNSQVLDRTIIEKTPWGTNVTTYINFEAIAADRQAGDDYYRDDTDGTYIYTYPPYSSTDRFNCHGYAWYMSDAAGGTGHLDPRSIGTSNGTLPYISDGISYKRVYSESDADIVWWSNGNHSAITTETPWVWRSKFQFGPLVEHDWDDTPYGVSGLEYYKRCFYRISDCFDSDADLNFCKLELYNASVSANTDLEIEFEDWILIKGTFSTGIGAILNIHP
jgi:hypothetical protein